MKKLVILFSGGKTSAMMTKLLIDKYRGKREIIIIFNNTGKEKEATLEFVKKCDEEWHLGVIWLESIQHHGERKSASYRVVDFITASRNGEPFEDMIKKHGIPNSSFKHCSRELKTNPTVNYLKDHRLDESEVAIGIRIDEPSRLIKNANYKFAIYPLATEWKINSAMVQGWWAGQNFSLNLKNWEGNCDMCWKKSKRKHLTLLLDNPGIAQWWNEMEIKYGNFIPPTQSGGRIAPITFFRKHESVQDLLEDSKLPFDKINESAIQLHLLMFFDPELDSTDGCEESCDAV